MNSNFRIEFVKEKIKNRFHEFIKTDNVLNLYINEVGDNHILFKFKSDKVRDLIVDTIINNLPKSCRFRIKYTSLGFKYLKIYKL